MDDSDRVPFSRYRCRGCRFKLFDSGALEAHSLVEQKRPCTSWFLEEPEDWMVLDDTQQGKLSCPRCEAKVGSWDWAGIRCACGAWVAPGFQIAKSKVDFLLSSRKKKTSFSEGKDFGGKIHWLRSRPPPCVVVVCGPGSEAEVREALERRWAGRHVKDSFASWLFVGQESFGDLADLLTHLARNCGLHRNRIACGGIGHAAAQVALDSDCAATFGLALAEPRGQDKKRIEASAPHRKTLLVLCGDSSETWDNVTVAPFARLEPATLTDGVVRTLCTWLSETLPGCGILDTSTTTLQTDLD